MSLVESHVTTWGWKATSCETEVVADPPSALVKQTITLKNDVSTEVSSDVTLLFQHPFNNEMAIRECILTINDARKIKAELVSREDAEEKYRNNAQYRRILCSAQSEKVLGFRLGGLSSTDKVQVVLEIDLRMKSSQLDGNGDLVCLLEMPLYSLNDVTNPTHGSQNAPISDTIRTVKVRGSSRQGCRALEGVKHSDGDELALEMNDNNVYTEQTSSQNLYLQLKFGPENPASQIKHSVKDLASGQHQQPKISTSFAADCVYKQHLNAYVVSTDFIVHRDIVVGSSAEKRPFCFNFIVDRSFFGFDSQQFDRLKRQVQLAVEMLRFKSPNCKFNIFVAGISPGYRTRFSLSGFRNLPNLNTPLSISDERNFQAAKNFINQIGNTNEPSKMLSDTLKSCLHAAQSNENCLHRVIFVSDCCHSDFDLGVTSASNYFAEENVNLQTAQNRCFILTTGPSASLDNADTLAQSTYGGHRHLLLDSANEQLSPAFKEILDMASALPCNMKAMVKLTLHGESGNELYHSEQTVQRLADIPYLSKVGAIFDGFTVRTTRNQFLNTSGRNLVALNDNLQELNFENNHFQRLSLLEARPKMAKVELEVFEVSDLNDQLPVMAARYQNEVQIIEWNDKDKPNDRVLSRNCFRERIIGLETHYKSRLRMQDTDQLTIHEKRIIALSIMTGTLSSFTAFIGVVKNIDRNTLQPNQETNQAMEVDDSASESVSETPSENLDNTQASHDASIDFIFASSHDQIDNVVLNNSEQHHSAGLVGGPTTAKRPCLKPAIKANSRPSGKSRPRGHNRPAGNVTFGKDRLKIIPKKQRISNIGQITGFIPRNESSQALLCDITKLNNEQLNEIRTVITQEARIIIDPKYADPQKFEKCVETLKKFEKCVETLILFAVGDKHQWFHDDESNYRTKMKQHLERSKMIQLIDKVLELIADTKQRS